MPANRWHVMVNRQLPNQDISLALTTSLSFPMLPTPTFIPSMSAKHLIVFNTQIARSAGYSSPCGDYQSNYNSNKN